MASIKDVARLAGVSEAAVSRVLNGNLKVKQETYERIMAAVEELGYKPNMLARGLAMGRTGTIGLIVPDISTPFLAAIARGVESAAYPRGYNVVLCDSSEDPDKEAAYVDLLMRRLVDGVIVAGAPQQAGSTDRDALDMLKAARIPTVLISRKCKVGRCPSVDFGQAQGCGMAAEHLAELGHKHIGMVAGPATVSEATDAVEGFHEFMSEHGEMDPSLVEYSDYKLDGGQKAADVLLKRHPEITGIVAGSELLGVAVLRAAKSKGREVPRDLSIITLGETFLAPSLTPSLSTISYDMQLAGRSAVEMLEDLINEAKAQVTRVTIEPVLKPRESTAAC